MFHLKRDSIASAEPRVRKPGLWRRGCQCHLLRGLLCVSSVALHLVGYGLPHLATTSRRHAPRASVLGCSVGLRYMC